VRPRHGLRRGNDRRGAKLRRNFASCAGVLVPLVVADPRGDWIFSISRKAWRRCCRYRCLKRLGAPVLRPKCFQMPSVVRRLDGKNGELLAFEES
jgi:hypothetical protein